MKVINKTYNIDSGLNKNIVLISDIHYKDKEDIKRLNYILENIKKINPDYICIPGDIIDKSRVEYEEVFINWLKRLSKITKVIISIGNHEFYMDTGVYGLNKSFFNKVSNINNLYLLDNKNVIIDDINFIGFTIPIEYYKENYNSKDFIECLDKIKTYKKYYNILLCHSPINICNKDILKNRNIDLILCGHMHGGVVPKFIRPILKNKGLISPNKKLFPKFAYGYLKINKTSIIITSGLRVLPFKNLNKLFNPEIVMINLTLLKK